MNRQPGNLYTVYDNKIDFPVIVCGTVKEAARAMGVKVCTLYSLTSRKPRTQKRWTVIKVSRVLEFPQLDTVGNRLEYAIAKSGKTKTSFAKEIHVSPATVCNWCADRQKIGKTRLSDITRILNITLKFLFDTDKKFECAVEEY
ncbi:MAG: helix-turn-helix transcriptional regulator [Clostridia bacterium]|nr:helix-turn-helix transcriptional regulator [Clostridia bacterium]